MTYDLITKESVHIMCHYWILTELELLRSESKGSSMGLEYGVYINIIIDTVSTIF